MLSKKVIAKCLKDAVLECHKGNCRDCKYYKDKTWCLVRMQTDKIYKTIKMKSFNSHNGTGKDMILTIIEVHNGQKTNK